VQNIRLRKKTYLVHSFNLRPRFPSTKVTDVLAPGNFRIYNLSTRVFVGGKNKHTLNLN